MSWIWMFLLSFILIIYFDFFMYFCWFILSTIWKCHAQTLFTASIQVSPFFFANNKLSFRWWESFWGNRQTKSDAPYREHVYLHFPLFMWPCFTFHVGTVNHPVPWSIMGMHCATESLGNCDILWKSRWWFQSFFIFIPTWGNDPIWPIFFTWVETTN